MNLVWVCQPQQYSSFGGNWLSCWCFSLFTAFFLHIKNTHLNISLRIGCQRPVGASIRVSCVYVVEWAKNDADDEDQKLLDLAELTGGTHCEHSIYSFEFSICVYVSARISKMHIAWPCKWRMSRPIYDSMWLSNYRPHCIAFSILNQSNFATCSTDVDLFVQLGTFSRLWLPMGIIMHLYSIDMDYSSEAELVKIKIGNNSLEQNFNGSHAFRAAISLLPNFLSTSFYNI